MLPNSAVFDARAAASIIRTPGASEHHACTSVAAHDDGRTLPARHYAVRHAHHAAFLLKQWLRRYVTFFEFILERVTSRFRPLILKNRMRVRCATDFFLIYKPNF